MHKPVNTKGMTASIVLNTLEALSVILCTPTQEPEYSPTIIILVESTVRPSIGGYIDREERAVFEWT